MKKDDCNRSQFGMKVFPFPYEAGVQGVVGTGSRILNLAAGSIDAIYS
jgi:hypothetical protein